MGEGWYEAKQKGGDAAWTVVQAMLDDFSSGKPKYKDAKFVNVKMPKEVPMTVQDRAYTSPIWYTP